MKNKQHMLNILVARAYHGTLWVFAYCMSGKRRWATLLFLILVAYLLVFSAPWRAAPSQVVAIDNGMALEEIARRLADENVIRSELVFRGLVSVLGTATSVPAGSYYFKDPQSVFGVAYRLANGVFGVVSVRVVIPEGSTSKEIAEILKHEIPTFDKEKFYELARAREGYLYPDTYFILPTATPEQVIAMMESNFAKKLTSIRATIRSAGKSLREIVTMASLLEKEASDFETRRLISGVLWNRLEQNMPLQVDAAFLYINGKNTYELSVEDLAIDSEYNTYKYAGLPPTPIANPSIEAIAAAASPILTNYLFYLADRKGKTYFSETFEEHKEKKRQYVW